MYSGYDTLSSIMGEETTDNADDTPTVGAPIPVKPKEPSGSQGAAALPNRSMDRWTWTDKAGRKRRLSPKQIKTVQGYIATGNMTQAAADAGYVQSYGSLKHTGSTTISLANQHGMLQAEMEQAGIGRPVQLHRLSDVINSRYQWSDSTTSYDADGNVVKSTRITRQPSARDITAAVATADRISGAREQRKVQADVVSAELKALIKKHCPTTDGIKLADRPRQASPAHANDVDKQGDGTVQADAPTGLEGVADCLTSGGGGGIGAAV